MNNRNKGRLRGGTLLFPAASQRKERKEEDSDYVKMRFLGSTIAESLSNKGIKYKGVR